METDIRLLTETDQRDHTGLAPVKCSFSGRAADFYVGLTLNPENSPIRIVGAVCNEFVETALINLLGQESPEIQWPVVLDMNKNLLFHSFEANKNGLSTILGWKEFCLGLLPLSQQKFKGNIKQCRPSN